MSIQLVATSKFNCIVVYTGIIDSSGLRFYFTDEPPQQNAGIMIVGQPFVGHMIVPPRVERYTVAGHCQQKCTDAVSTLILLAVKMCGGCGHIQKCDCVCNN